MRIDVFAPSLVKEDFVAVHENFVPPYRVLDGIGSISLVYTYIPHSTYVFTIQLPRILLPSNSLALIGT